MISNIYNVQASVVQKLEHTKTFFLKKLLATYARVLNVTKSVSG